MQTLEAKLRNAVAKAGGVKAAVDILTDTCRLLWRSKIEEQDSEKSLAATIADALASVSPRKRKQSEFVTIVQQILLDGGYVGDLDHRVTRGRPQLLFHPIRMVEAVLEGIARRSDLEYFVMQNIRHTHSCSLSPQTSASFYRSAKRLHAYITPRKGYGYSEIVSELLRDRTSNSDGDGQATLLRHSVDAFLETCRAVGYYHPSGDKAKGTPQIEFREEVFDPEYLISRLFGLRTSIPGFDELFGGGGILLAESWKEQKRRTLSDQSEFASLLPPRTTLIRGRFGSGKSLLALQLCSELASKGGIAWYFALEQTVTECMYLLSTMGLYDQHSPFDIATTDLRAQELLESIGASRGLLILLNLKSERFSDLLSVLEQQSQVGSAAPLRMICVDPINSVTRPTEGNGVTELRRQTTNSLREIKSNGANILLVGEEYSREVSELHFEENIADTVITLSPATIHGHSQRLIEVTKSRLQREARGAHPISIQPGRGISVHPGATAVRARSQSRSDRLSDLRGRFGIPSLDEVLGGASITNGSVTVVQGPIGTFKSRLGALFLTEHREDFREQILKGKKNAEAERRISLLVTMRFNEARFQELMQEDLVTKTIEQRTFAPGLARDEFKTRKNYLIHNPKHIRVCQFQGGFIAPGAIFQLMGDQIQNCLREGLIVDRVFLDDVSEWGDFCPFIKDDETFVPTLLEFLRRQSIAIVATCSPSLGEAGTLTGRLLLENADTIIDLERFEYRNCQRILLRVRQSSTLKQHRDTYELTTSSVDGFHVTRTASLLRVGGPYDVRPISIRLLLQQESPMQQAYNQQILKAVKAVLSESAEYTPPNHLQLTGALSAGQFSAIDELQVVQLDEHQLSRDRDRLRSELHVFEHERWQENAHLWSDIPEGLVRRIQINVDGDFVAVPFYDNLSFLTFREEFGAEHIGSWEKIARRCEQLAKKRPTNQEAETTAIFDFPRGTTENFNCLFMEVLASLKKPPIEAKSCSLSEWFTPTSKKNDEVIAAAHVYRRICRPAYQAAKIRRQQGQSAQATDRSKASKGTKARGHNVRRFDVDRNALIWRHWFTTFESMIRREPSLPLDTMLLGPLPGHVTMSGEWYLAIPAYSAASDVGLEIIKLLTSRQAELERLHQGVGLPTRPTAFDRTQAGTIVRCTEYSLSYFHDLGQNRLSRSSFGCYQQLSRIIADYLKLLIEIDDTSDLKESVSGLIRRMLANFKLIESEQACHFCSCSQRRLLSQK